MYPSCITLYARQDHRMLKMYSLLSISLSSSAHFNAFFSAAYTLFSRSHTPLAPCEYCSFQTWQKKDKFKSCTFSVPYVCSLLIQADKQEKCYRTDHYNMLQDVSPHGVLMVLQNISFDVFTGFTNTSIEPNHIILKLCCLLLF